MATFGRTLHSRDTDVSDQAICVIDRFGKQIYLGHCLAKAAGKLEEGCWFGKGWSENAAREQAIDRWKRYQKVRNGTRQSR